MARAFWKGAISFGLVAIPVKMYVGTESKTLSFRRRTPLSAGDGGG